MRPHKQKKCVIISLRSLTNLQAKYIHTPHILSIKILSLILIYSEDYRSQVLLDYSNWDLHQSLQKSKG